MVYCDGEKACGNAMFVAAACGSNSCGTLFSNLIRRGLVESPGKPIARTQSERQRATTISYLKIIRKGYWCMPCCILDENVHPKMKVCSSLPTDEEICKQQESHGRCGIEFLSVNN